MQSTIDLLSPSAYNWLLPNSAEISSIDQLVRDGLFPSIADLHPAVVYAFLFGLARTMLHTAVFKPFIIFVLKLSYSRQAADKDIDHQSDKKRDETNDRKVAKFSEALWRGLFYSCFCVLGIVTLSSPDTTWISDTKEHWNNWPHHPISSLMYHYYQIELGCYLHQLYWTEIVRSDWLEMTIHHIITITLIMASYLTNFTRIGCSILVLHDFADIFLEFAKCTIYLSKVPSLKKSAQPITDGLFTIFALSFAVTRLYIYPRFLVYSLVYEAPAILGMWSGYWLFATMLVGLQCLHVFWFALILKMVWKLLSVGNCGSDVRESDDEWEGSDDGAEHPSVDNKSSKLMKESERKSC